jgi:hypothetical protein
VQHISVTETSRLILIRTVIAVLCTNDVKRTSMLCGRNAEFLCCKEVGIFSNQWQFAHELICWLNIIALPRSVNKKVGDNVDRTPSAVQFLDRRIWCKLPWSVRLWLSGMWLSIVLGKLCH